MDAMTVRRAALIAGLIALLVYLPALGNRFALDDSAIVERNPAAHSVSAALAAFDQAYWPPEHAAGLWRPLVILSFAADWQLSGGGTTWLHATNVLLHAAATALITAVAPFTSNGPPRHSSAAASSGTGKPGSREAKYTPFVPRCQPACAMRQPSASTP